MIFRPTPLAGLVEVWPEKMIDARGFFARQWCAEAFAAAGYPFMPGQISTSFNEAAFTLRGMHFQAAPFGETKLVRATSGRVFDVAVDLREGSATRYGWHGVMLDASAHNALLIPPGFAHGFLTLSAGAELLYLIDVPFAAGAARGVRWDDPAFGIAWPGVPAVMSGRDADYPLVG